MAQAAVLPVLFAVDRDPNLLEAMLSDLSGRFGKDFTVTGETSREAALAALQEMAAAQEPVALLLVDDAASDLLARAHELHPRAKRVLLIDRDYSSTSPAPQAMTLGRADYYIVRPWTDDEIMYESNWSPSPIVPTPSAARHFSAAAPFSILGTLAIHIGS